MKIEINRTSLLALALAGLALNVSVIQPSQAGSGSFYNTGSMSIPRSSFTATLLPNGKVLAAGGTGDGGRGWRMARWRGKLLR